MTQQVAAVRIYTPGVSERVIALGKSGSGKTTILRGLLGRVANGVIIDTKKNEEEYWRKVKGAKFTKTEPHKLGSGLWVWAPPDAWLDDREWINRSFIELYRQKGARVIYVDEFGDVAPSANRYPPALKTLAMRGRSAKKGLWGTTQRPADVPLFLLSEANHYFVCHTSIPQDQKRIDRLVENPVHYAALAPVNQNKSDPLNYKFFYKASGMPLQGPTWLPREAIAA